VKRVRISCVVFRNDKRIVILCSVRRIMASVVVRYLLLIYLLVQIHRKTTKESMPFPVNTKSAMANILDCINNNNLLRCQNADKRTVQTNGDE